MSDFIILVKNNIRVLWGSIKNRRKGRYATAGAFIGFAFLLFGFIMISNSVSQVAAMNELGVPELAVFISLIMALTLGIVFSLMRAVGPSAAQDGDLLLAMPLERTTIVLSKIVTHYMFDAPLMIVIIGSSTIAYTVITGAGPAVLIRGLILTFLLPLFPISLSYLLGAGLARLQKVFKSTGLITTGLMMVILMGYLFFTFQSSSLYSMAEGLTHEGAAGIINRLAPLGWLTHFVLDGNLIDVLLSLVLLIVPFYIGVRVYARDFGKSKASYHSTKKTLDFPVRSPKKALLSKEVKRYFACSIYVVNTLFTPIMVGALTVAILIMGPEKVGSLANLPPEAGLDVRSLIPYILVGLFCALAGLTTTTAPSISLEGNQLWILKAHPLEAKDIFWAKYMLNIFLMVPVTVLGAILVGIRMGYQPVEIIGMALMPALFATAVSFAGLIANLLFPRFDWTSETSVVKQSMSVFVTMMFSAVTMIVPFIIYFLFFQSLGLASLLVTGSVCYFVLAALGFGFLRTKGPKLFAAL